MARRTGALALVTAGFALGLWVRFGPVDEELLDTGRFASMTVLDRNGAVLYEPLSRAGGRGKALDPAELPPLVVAATLAAEDRRFFSHPGVDSRAIARAVWRNVRNARVVEGGSTITQQVAKLLRGEKGRSWRNKLAETLLAIRLEGRLTKPEILALYLNMAPYGNRIHGIGRASRAYFGCAPADLTAAQAAFLAALPQRPGAFNPLRDPSSARARQQAILSAMELPAGEHAAAMRERLRFERAEQALIAQHFVERVVPLCGAPNGVCVTTLDAGLQRQVAGIIAAHRPALIRHGAKSVAVAVLDNRSGQWLAWEGSGDYFGEQVGGAIDGVVTPRQPGSTLKPFTYALAFEQGSSPATVVADVRSHFPTAQEGVVYTPRNYDGRHRGPLRIRAALAGSQNVPAVATLARLGAPSLLRLLRNAGFDGLQRTAGYYGLGLTLGDAEVRLDQLVTAYAAFARGGVPVRPTMLRDAPAASGERLFSRRTAFWIGDILSDPQARAYAFGEGGSLDFPFRVAVKTGTSQAYRDNWTVGYTREVTVGVWVGNFDRAELRHSSGVTGAAPLFNAVMLAAVRHVLGRLPIGDEEPIVAPDGVERLPICGTSGLRPSPWCPTTESEWLAKEAPAEFCSWHRRSAVQLPAEYAVWAPARGAAAPATMLQVTSPPDGATYLIDPTLRPEFQKLRFTATRPARWYVGEQEA
ncbi:MAG TPA: penicillin-binding protein 1C, partial [Thermoanaerobaculia bacterium]|nr:penicillin-binding protein 1C [Thermoanaerobaculia bacterium]